MFFFGRVQSIFLYQTSQNDEMKALCRPKLQFSMFDELSRYCLQQWEFAISCAEQLKDLSTAWIIREFPSDPFDQTYSCIRVIYWRAKRTLVNETCPGKAIKNHGAGRITRHYITIEKKLNQEKKMPLLSHLPLVFILKPLFEWGGSWWPIVHWLTWVSSPLTISHNFLAHLLWWLTAEIQDLESKLKQMILKIKSLSITCNIPSYPILHAFKLNNHLS